MVTRLDRLARSTRDLLNLLDEVAKAGAGFKSLADAWADTTTPHGKLMLTWATRWCLNRYPPFAPKVGRLVASKRSVTRQSAR
jgi:Resolvase, N terminal domain